ncbi:hypothetical protein TNCV_501371 [Trichonephila clavipes]|nr:hypothetical protein TNCV_501371 [Trichonephila clavipes]
MLAIQHLQIFCWSATLLVSHIEITILKLFKPPVGLHTAQSIAKTLKCADASSIRSARIQRPPASTANATGPSCLGNPHPVSTPKRASDFCSPYQGFLDKADSNSPSLSRNGNDSEMANLPTDMELEMNLSQRSETRSPSPQSQLAPCEQLKYNKAQLAKMETFRKFKQACVGSLRQMPDHYPEEPFFVRALTELQEIEETMAIAVSDIDSFDPC